MKRSKHSLSNYRLLTGDMGRLIPINLTECLPGDTIQQSTSLLLRMSPLLAPVMHPVTVRLHHWFVPMRLLWDQWEDFITGGPDGLGASEPIPTNDGAYNVPAGGIYDYLGVPLIQVGDNQLSTLPLTCYNLIFNEWYRDQDLVPEVDLGNDLVQNIAWEKDYFTRSRPWAQKGPNVTIPIGQEAKVYPDQSTDLKPLFGVGSSITGLSGGNPSQVALTQTVGETFPTDMAWNNPKLVADLANAEPPDVRAVRLAFALQRYQEARAQYGSRYTEYLRYLGIRPSDARLQRPEYLGGGKQTVAFSEVLRTGNDPGGPQGDGPIGELLGHGIAAMRSNRYRYFCEEHGYEMTLLSVRPRTMYQDGIHRTFARRTKEDFYQRELELIGQQEIKNEEIFAQGAGFETPDAETFGYADRYSEYRHTQSGVSGEFRQLLDYWHLGRKFGTAPVLNQDFVECDPSKRIFAEQTQHSMWIMANHSIQARRMLGKRTIGKII